MNPIDLIRAWKGTRPAADHAAQGASMANPAGDIELDERELGLVFGGMRPPEPKTNKWEHTCENWACTFSPVVCG